MTQAAHPSLFRRLMGASSSPAPELDPADMGTAMGLDFCLDEPPADLPAPGALATTAGAAAAQVSWLRRLSAS
ncbi:hypothetical protein [Ideonella sp.]|uniref:hypothetical protein n=1 Tax=Ideonella sp. TaxID=1929293 RepID=UPI0035AFE2C9